MHTTAAGRPAAPAGAAAGRIGPNAITRVAEALQQEFEAGRVAELFGLAGLEEYLHRPPQHMVDEQAVMRLHAVLRTQLPAEQARRISRDAGARTGAYLLAHRIPRPVQRLLRILPARAASRVLAAAITRNAWTFAGTARFSARGGRPARFALTGCPLCRGAQSDAACCDYYAACFEHLFGALVHPRARVRETSCAAAGADACRFEVAW
jgi:divinyl protochlorophyllide a 8-vinyl-reductase